ncbi:MAG TPA: 50S ribosomal protein L23 [Candidatus Brocadiia bacterium]|nr:50S ribosomal protein L23 [Candidatus Brocadiia bacterium]
MKLKPHQVIIRPIHTEKSVSDMQGNNTYHLVVHRKAGKDDVKRAIETLFAQNDVKVTNVRTCMMPGKPRRYRYSASRTPSWKKAIVTLRRGDTIDIGI